MESFSIKTLWIGTPKSCTLLVYNQLSHKMFTTKTRRPINQPHLGQPITIFKLKNQASFHVKSSWRQTFVQEKRHRVTFDFFSDSRSFVITNKFVFKVQQRLLTPGWSNGVAWVWEKNSARAKMSWTMSVCLSVHPLCLFVYLSSVFTMFCCCVISHALTQAHVYLQMLRVRNSEREREYVCVWV